ncbi:MAG: hypothetical protein DWQ49_09420 [Bacteroidetes bacterium]|nr:MAG: hypothetical protein DWQ49_09420 [Bacteroidota bacterium]
MFKKIFNKFRSPVDKRRTDEAAKALAENSKAAQRQIARDEQEKIKFEKREKLLAIRKQFKTMKRRHRNKIARASSARNRAPKIASKLATA